MIQPFPLLRDSDGSLTRYAWPGGYPVYYVTTDGAGLCPTCATQHGTEKDGSHSGWELEGADINWEDPELFCDHCNTRIPSAYAEPDD